ncbi:hypothetical protein AB0A69_15460 [Streptomyces sp. NPDC045431]|uniref:hypothetical protein n=1 Tax=Streptomyces sp. NPDC045431 TaxID=3155613 RepID=UPI0033FD2252
MRTRKRWRRGAGVLAGAAAVAALAAGCGIRPTVPVDAGAAPSRMPCTLSESDSGSGSGSGSGSDAAGAEGRQGLPVTVYLVCASGLEPVRRTADEPPVVKGRDSRVAVAGALLAQLSAEPSASERQAGFVTYVEPPLSVSAGREGDPARALRLSRQPDDLPPAALSQLVCTYAENAATTAGDDTVVLGGPGDRPARRYACTKAVKERPESVEPTAEAPAS